MQMSDTKSQGEAIRVFLVDVHPVYRMGLCALVNKEADMQVVGEADCGRDALKQLEECEVDLVITDLSLQDISGLELIKLLRKAKPELPIFVISMHDEDIFAERAVKLGAQGYLMKQSPPKELVTAIRQASRGELTLSAVQANIIMKRAIGKSNPEDDSPLQLLSDREIEVFELVGRGNSTKNIAERLFISIKTVETHQAHIKRKLSLANHNELMRAGFTWVNDISR